MGTPGIPGVPTVEVSAPLPGALGTDLSVPRPTLTTMNAAPPAPRRIQRQRTTGWRMPVGAVYVGRISRWGNPWRIVGVHDTHFAFSDAADVIHVTSGASIGRFDRIQRTPGTGAFYWAARQYQSELTDTDRTEIRGSLAGKTLACWCPETQPCHGDVLLAIANDQPIRWPS